MLYLSDLRGYKQQVLRLLDVLMACVVVHQENFFQVEPEIPVGKQDFYKSERRNWPINLRLQHIIQALSCGRHSDNEKKTMSDPPSAKRQRTEKFVLGGSSNGSRFSLGNMMNLSASSLRSFSPSSSTTSSPRSDTVVSQQLDNCGYTVRQKIQEYAESSATLYRVTRRSDGKPICVLVASEPGSEEFSKEISTWRELYPDVPTAPDGNGAFMLIEDQPNGETLSHHLQRHGPLGNSLEGLRHFFRMAKCVTEAVRKMHEKRTVHFGLRPENIVYDDTVERVRIVSWFYSAKFNITGQMQSDSWNSRALAQSMLPYVSPEQTGRTSFDPDYRSDYYSLGVVFFKSLCGRLPFNAPTSAQAIHCHLAVHPPLLSTINPIIPAGLSRVISRMMEKAPHERYQSARGILSDLQQCEAILDALQTDSPLSEQNFTPGKNDISNIFKVPNKVYGREEEIKAALYHINKMITTPPKEGTCSSTILMISGPSGVGKSSVVKQVRRQLRGAALIYCQGSFDKSNRDRPYTGVLDAVSGLIDLLMQEDHHRIEFVRDQLERRLGAGGPVLVDLLPRLRLVYNEPIGAVIPQETQERAHVFTESLITALDVLVEALGSKKLAEMDAAQQSKQHNRVPLMMASYTLISRLLKGCNTKIFLVGLYRSNEMDFSLPFGPFLEEMRRAGISMKELSISHLRQNDIISMVADTLSCSISSAESLAQWISGKCHGNPLFVAQYLSHLYLNHYITFDYAEGEWRWDVDHIRQNSSPPEDIVEFLLQSLSKASSKEMLQLAACFGTVFRPSSVAWLMDCSLNEVESKCWEAEREGFIMREHLGQRYRFLHDRLAHTAYQLNSPDELARNHLRIGRYLMYQGGENGPDLFEFIRHLNLASDQIRDPKEIWDLISWNLQAGVKAKDTLAYESALEFLSLGLKLSPISTPSEASDTQRSLLFRLRLQRAECNFLYRGEVEDSDETFQSCMEWAADDTEKRDALSIWNDVRLFSSKYDVMIEGTLQFLRKAGYELPRRPTLTQITEQESKTDRRFQEFGKIEPCDLIVLPSQLTETDISIFRLVHQLAVALWWTAETSTLRLLCAQFVGMSMDVGFHPAISLLICLYANSKCYAEQYSLAYRWALLAEQLIQHPSCTHSWQSASVLNLALPLGRPLALCADIIRNAFKDGSVAGDGFFCCINVLQLLNNTLCASNNPPEALKELNSMISWCEKRGPPGMSWMIKVAKHRVEDQYGESTTSTEEEVLLSGSHDALRGLFFYGSNLRNLYLTGDYTTLIEYVEKAIAAINPFSGVVVPLEVYYYGSLGLLSEFKGMRDEDKQRSLERVEFYLHKLKQYTHSCPANFAHRSLLVDARIKQEGDLFSIMEMFREALKLAETAHNYNDAAIAETFLSRCLEEISRKIQQKSLVTHARAGNRRRLETKRRRISQSSVFEAPKGYEGRRRRSNEYVVSAELDLQTVVNASQEISSAVELDVLNHKVLMNVTSSSGATKGVLLIAESDDEGQGRTHARSPLIVCALAKSQAESIESVPQMRVTTLNVPLEEDNQELCSAFVHYSWNCGDMASYRSDSSMENSTVVFSEDPYVKRNKVQAMICIPFVSRGRRQGAIYLENTLYTGAFTPDRLRIIRILISQMMISLENALLVKELSRNSEELRKKNEDMTRRDQVKDEFLALTSHELRTPLSGILGMCSLILDTKMSQEQQEFVGHIQNSAEILNELVGDILEVSKLKAGRVHLENKLMSVVDVVESSISVVEFRAIYKGLNLVYTLADDVPDNMVADRSRVQQVLVNLLNNAIKFSESGDIRVKLSMVTDEQTKRRNMEEDEEEEEDPLSMTTNGSEGVPRTYIRFQVVDNGIGISPENADLLFRPFSQVESSNHRQAQGTGLGLHICRQMCQLMNGRIWLEDSKTNVGSTFAFQIPLGIDGVSTTANLSITDFQHTLAPGFVQWSIIDSKPIRNNSSTLASLMNREEMPSLGNGKERIILWIHNRSNREILLALLSRVAQVSPANSMEDVQSLMKNHLASILVVDITLVLSSRIDRYLFTASYSGLLVTVGNALELKKRSEIELPLHQVTPLKTPLKQSNIISSMSAAFERMKKPEIPTESRSPNAVNKPLGGKMKRVLVVDDNALNRKMVCKMLEPLGFQLDCVVDGKLAVEASYHNRYDAILMDVQMPVMDGLQATEIIRQKEALQMRRTPIIGLSASVSEHDQRVCYDAGMDDFVPKPIKRDLLISRLENWLRKEE
ncbi:putative ATPase [Planoprotostelium fungivorum]|uniref:Putative ATPase n=1 Tax=Planoprotostelium fungivorum TaxID=1890364 RepID=A0A2P6NLE0_9EUKA|nr:putative ATPase [Planoprotostelium fungivorum]